MKILITLILMAGLGIFGAKLNAQNFDHAVFDGLLQKYVSNGLVDYRGFKTDGHAFAAYLKQIQQVDPDSFRQWPEAEQKAFWINAYNAITIEGILRNYPIQPGGFIARARFPKNSIRQIGGFWDKVFVEVMGKELTLNDMEHKILRKEFADPRIHFAIVCASIGCPILENRAFFAEDLDQRLEQAARNFIANPEKVRLDREKNVLYLSSIFDWYKKDFPVWEEGRKLFARYESEKGVVEFISHYLPEGDRNYIIQNRPKIKYLKYDWSLNEQKN